MLKSGQYVNITDGKHAGKTAWLIVDTNQPDSDDILVAFDAPSTGSAHVKGDHIQVIPAWFAVIGRIPEDDEDTTMVFSAASQDAAIDRFIKEMYEEDDQDRDEVRATHGVDIIITSVLTSTSLIVQTHGHY